MTSRLVKIAIAVALAVIGFAAYRIYWKQESAGLRVSGNIEATPIDVSFKIPGLMVKRFVDEGDGVKKGEVIARLDDAQLEEAVLEQRAEVRVASWALAELLRGSRPEAIAQARAGERRARYALEELLRGSRPEAIAQARAAARQAASSLWRARREYRREKKLYAQGYIPALTYDNEKAAYQAADAAYRQTEQHYAEVLRGPRIEEIQQAREAWRQALWNFREVVKGPRIEEIQQARARLKAAQQALAQARTTLGYATIVSPVNGIVLSKDAEPGEYVSAGTPVVTVADLSNVWLRAYINETDLGRVKYGVPVRVATDTYPGKIYRGRVSFISSEAEFTPKSVQTYAERVKLVYRIKIDIANPGFELKPGMPADADF